MIPFVKGEIATADKLNGNFAGKPEVVASLAALRQLSVPGTTDAQLVVADGYASANDGGGGTFIWSSTVTSADDGGTIIAPGTNPAQGRWLRLFTGPINIKWFGAKGDGAADDTTPVQSALNAVSIKGGIAYAPPGQYRLTAKVTIPQWVLFMGQSWLPDPSNSAQAFATSLYIDWGAGQDNHAVEMSHSSGIEGFTFFYPGQVANTAATPVQFGFSISTPTTPGVYDNIYIRNITLYNSYKGIRLNNGGRWRVENIQGDPLSEGFTADQCLDVCYMKGVHFWNFYTQGNALENWVAANGAGFSINRVDQLFAKSVFVWNRADGFYLGSGFWGNFVGLLVDKAERPITLQDTANVKVSNFTLIPNGISKPAIWVVSGTSDINFSTGTIADTGAVGCEIGSSVTSGTSIKFSAVKFANKHSAVVDLSGAADVRIDDACDYNVPPFGGYNVRLNGERLPASSAQIALPAPSVTGATAISGGYSFDLSAGNQSVAWETTYISERNSLFVLEFDYKITGTPVSWEFQLAVQSDVGTDIQVVFQPSAPLLLNGALGSTVHVRIPFFINHGRYRQVMLLSAIVSTPTAGASIAVTNVALYEQSNQDTTDAQVSNMMRSGYNTDAFGMGQTLFSKGKNRIVLTEPESGIGRSTEVPIYGTWAQGDEIRAYAPTAGGAMGYVCTSAGTNCAAAWAASTAYAVGQQVSNGGDVYQCTTAGTSAASGGPSGTASSITDGTVVWEYINPVAIWKSYGGIAA